jgi:peptide-methionine (S)-S-oxide reductase
MKEQAMRNIVYALMVAFFTHSGAAMADTTKTAVFAGGCFWCMEPEFANLDGVSKVVSGYTGGHVKHPTYQQVSAGITGHVEAIEITYDPSKVSYDTLLDIFWKNIDPLDEYGQFCDKGSQYRAGIMCMMTIKENRPKHQKQRCSHCSPNLWPPYPSRLKPLACRGLPSGILH